MTADPASSIAQITETIAVDIGRQPAPRVFLRMIALAMFLLPTAYLAGVLSVLAHEVLGHGITAWIVGGTFRGFAINWDGGGWAMAAAPPGSPEWKEIAVLAGGCLAETEVGLLCLLLTIPYRRRFYMKTALLLVGYFCLTEALSYVFWGLYQPSSAQGQEGLIADFTRIYQITGNAYLHSVLMPAAGLLFLATTIGGSLLLFRWIEEYVAGTQGLHGWLRAVSLLAFLALPGIVGWFIYDWEQIIPGIGRRPCIVGAAAQVICAALLYRWSLRPSTDQPELRGAVVPVIAVWMTALLLGIAMWSRSGKGVFWG